MGRAFLIIGLAVLCAAAATHAAVATHTASEDVYIDWNSIFGGMGNRNSAGLLRQQWSEDPFYHVTEIAKSYMKFQIPSDLATINSVTLRLSNLGVVGLGGAPVEIWALPDGYDGWQETVLTWGQATASYANQAGGRYFTAGQAVATGTCNVGNGTPTEFALDVPKMQALVDADTNNAITLTLAAMGTWDFCDRENSTPSLRPMLTWDYEVPEPATLSLLVLGGLACIRRRR